MNTAIGLGTGCGLSEVTRGNDHDDPCLDQLLDLDADRIVAIRIDRRRAEAEVCHFDVVLDAILKDPVQSVEEPGRTAFAKIVKYLDADDLGVSRDAAIRTALFI